MAATKADPKGRELFRSVILTMRNARTGYTIDDNHRRMVLTMAANGMSHIAIAAVMNIAKRTLETRFKAELAHGFEMIRGCMGAALVNEALDGNVSAQKFWLANRCPEWRQANEQIADVMPQSNDVVHFYLPPNHRNEPEQLPEPPTIEGEAEAA